MDGLSLARLCVHVSRFARGLFRDVGCISLVRRGRLRWVCAQVHCLRDVQLRLVVPLGCRVLFPVAGRTVTSTAGDWIEVPSVAGTTAVARTQYPLPGNAFVVYRGEKAYVRLENDQKRKQLLRYPGARRLSRSEAEKVGLPLSATQAVERARIVRLGDLIHAITAKVGIRTCAACRRRQRALNRIVVWGWWRTAAMSHGTQAND